MEPTVVFAAVLVLAGYFYVRWMWGKRNELVAQQRKLIDQAFTSRAVAGPSEELSFAPASAHLVHQKESVTGENAVLLQATRLYRNSFDEYFLFICSAGEDGFLKHLTKVEARRMLKQYPKAYVAEFGESA